MEENQVTTPVEKVPAEPTHEVAQNESTQNVVVQENAAYVPVRQAEPKRIHKDIRKRVKSMEENQVTTPVEEVPAEPTHEVAQNESAQNVVAQENAAYVPERQAKPKKIHGLALVMGILSIVFAILFPIAGDVLAIIGIFLSAENKKEYRTTASLLCSIIGLVLAIINHVLGAVMAVVPLL